MSLFRRVFVIGLDGATLTLVRPWAERGDLPILARLMAEGAYGPLQSVLPPVSAPAWSSFATGLNPGKHGIFGFRARIPGSYDVRLVNGRDRRGLTLWQLLNHHGRRVGVVNLPMTYPPDIVDGFMVSGMDTPDTLSAYTYPPHLAAELKTHLGEYIIELPLFAEARRGQFEQLWQKIVRNLENRIAAVQFLLANYDVDFFVVNFRATDSAQHYFWAGPEDNGRVLEVYRHIDRFLGWLLDRLPTETLLLVMSDHGFGPAGERAVLLNRWLVQQGYLAIRAGRLPRSLGQRAIGWLRHHTPEGFRQIWRRLWPRGYERVRAPAAHFMVDWSRSRVFADEQQGELWINLCERDPQGIVKPGAEAKNLTWELKQRLQALRDPATGAPVIAEVYSRDEIYHGPFAERAADLLVLPSEDPPVQFLPSDLSTDGEVVVPATQAQHGLPLLSGTHRSPGLLIAWGSGVRSGIGPLSNLFLVDLMPTILHSLGCPVPSGLDGRPLLELFQRPGAPRFADDEVKSAAATVVANKEDQHIIEERLRGLGYID